MASTKTTPQVSEYAKVYHDLWNRLLLEHPEVNKFTKISDWANWQKLHPEWPMQVWEFKEKPIPIEEPENHEEDKKHDDKKHVVHGHIEEKKEAEKKVSGEDTKISTSPQSQDGKAVSSAPPPLRYVKEISSSKQKESSSHTENGKTHTRPLLYYKTLETSLLKIPNKQAVVKPLSPSSTVKTPDKPSALPHPPQTLKEDKPVEIINGLNPFKILASFFPPPPEDPDNGESMFLDSFLEDANDIADESSVDESDEAGQSIQDDTNNHISNIGQDIANNVMKRFGPGETAGAAETTLGIEGGAIAGEATTGAALAGGEGAAAAGAATIGAEGAAAGAAAIAGAEGTAAMAGAAALAPEVGAVAAAGTPVWVIVAIVAAVAFLIIVIVVIMLSVTGQNNTAAGALLKVTKTGPTYVDNPTNASQPDMKYTINVTYPGTAQDIIVTDPLPQGTVFSSATEPYTLQKDTSGNTTAIQWSLAKMQGNQVSVSGSPSQEPVLDITTYTKSPYSLPPPSSASDTTYSASQIAALNELASNVSQYQQYLISKAKNNNPKYVDPFLSVIWSGAIEGTDGDNYSWNCGPTSKGTINQGCQGGYSSGDWQVGYGVQVSDAASTLAGDFNAAYGAGAADNQQQVQKVGQAVIDDYAATHQGEAITNPSTFPSTTIPSLVSEAQNGDTSAQQAVAILLMDKKVGAISVAQAIAGNISSQDNWRATMEGWNSYYATNMQKFANRIQELAKTYSLIGTTGVSNVNTTLDLVLHPLPNTKDTTIINQATAELIGAQSTASTNTTAGSSLSILDPASDPTGVESIKSDVISTFKKYSQDIAVYKQASHITGVPWQVLAGIHYREGGALPDRSLVSGRPIGSDEPDVDAGEGCSASAPKGVADGIPEPVPGGCGFSSLLDTAIYAGNHLKSKIGGIPQDFQHLVTALSRYNGGGNANCGKGVPYAGCPRRFEGDDDPYAMNLYDSTHKPMFIIYCADYTRCSSLVEDHNPGAATTAKWVSENF